MDKPYKSDDIIELALNNDVEEVQFYDVATQTLLSDIDDNHHNNTTAPPLIVVPSDQLYIMIDALHTAGYTNATGKFSYLPKDLISNSNLTDAEKQVNTELIEELEALEDVDEVFHDMQEQQWKINLRVVVVTVVALHRKLCVMKKKQWKIKWDFGLHLFCIVLFCCYSYKSI